MRAAQPNTSNTMSKVLVLYYSSYGHLEKMAVAVAQGAIAGGASVDIRRVPETAPKEAIEAGHFKKDTAHPVIESPWLRCAPAELPTELSTASGDKSPLYLVSLS